MRLVSSLAKVLGALLGALVAVVLLVYVAVNVGAVAAGVIQRHRTAEAVTQVLPRILPSAVEAHDELVAATGRDADRRWIEQACDFEHDDGGWMVIDWREVCVMRSVTAWQVGSEDEARALVPTTGRDQWAFDGCRSLGVAGEPGVVEGPEATYVDWTGGDEPWCLRELGPAVDTRTLDGERVELEQGRWLVLVAEQPLVDESIGCAHWSVLFCDNPWAGHALAD